MGNVTWDNIYKMSTASRLLRYIFRNAPVSRAGIAKSLDISPAMVTSITNSLITQGLVEDLGETEQGESGTVGRKRILIGFSGNARLSIGVELTKSNFYFCVTNLSGEILLMNKLPQDELEDGDVSKIISDGINQLTKSIGREMPPIIGAGIALPGHYDEIRHQFISHSGKWKSFDPDRIAQLTGLKITCENNVRAMAYQKYMFDIADCPENFVLIHIGAGIVCSQFSGGILIAGESVISGEIGHTIANPDGQKCECGKIGCLQTYSSESWIIKKAQVIYESSIQTALHSMANDASDITLEIIMAAYGLGDTLITRIIQDAVKYLAAAISNIAIILSPKKLYLHGRILQNAIIRQELQSFVDSQLLFVDKSIAGEICVLDFSSTRAVTGAAAIAIDRLLIQSPGLPSLT